MFELILPEVQFLVVVQITTIDVYLKNESQFKKFIYLKQYCQQFLWRSLNCTFFRMKKRKPLEWVLLVKVLAIAEMAKMLT